MFDKYDDVFTSGWTFDDDEESLKSRFQMANIALLTSAFAFIYGIVVNIIDYMPDFVLMESILLASNIALFIFLRKNRDSIEFVIITITAQCTLLLLYIIYTTDLKSMKHLWVFTYPIVLLYFQKDNNSMFWTIFLICMLMIAPYQNVIEVSYTPFEMLYTSVVLSVVMIIVFFYQVKMTNAKDLILKQQNLLKEQIGELTQKDQLLSAQSKQAVMGEMISMVAHQWRQPLSTVTLSVSNLQVKKLLGEKIDDKDFNKALDDISNTVVYLSNTIDDFQTYFRPVKEVTSIEAHALVKKAANFVLPRLKNTKILIEIKNDSSKIIKLETYMNELIQVILNILNNAIDALEIADVENPKIDITIEEKNDTVLMIIHDNANGIKQEDLGKIFEPYFSTKGKNGTGLGLYMSQMIIQKQFDGKISVISSENGTFFSVEIKKVLA